MLVLMGGYQILGLLLVCAGGVMAGVCPVSSVAPRYMMMMLSGGRGLRGRGTVAHG